MKKVTIEFEIDTDLMNSEIREAVWNALDNSALATNLAQSDGAMIHIAD